MITEAYENQIIEEVNKSSIKNQLLKDDLVDHLCCLVEMEMAKDVPFNTAFNNALIQTAPNGLNEIQKQTIFLLNYSKIMLMKRLTYASGYLFALAWAVGVFLKLMSLPSSMMLMYVGGSGLAFIFLPLLLVNKFKKMALTVMSEKLKWIFGISSAILFMLASLMKLGHLQGAVVMLGASFVVFCVGFLPFLFFRMYRKSVEEI